VWGLDDEQYAMVKEALHERRTVMHIAPYWTSALPIMCPIYKWWQAPYYWLGTKAYDLVAGKRALETSYWLSPTRAIQEFPMLKQHGLCGAVVYYDGQQNDSRMNVVLALTAAYYGATMVNHCAVTELRKDAEGKLCGAKVRDQMSGDEITVHARGVVNATGPFVDGIRRMDDPQCPLIIAPSSGTHIVLPHYYSPHHMGLIDPATSDGRVIFFLPWEGNTVAGTTDEPTEVTYSPTPKEKEISFILNEVSHYLSGDIMVRRGDVLSAWTGIRPLVRNPKATNTQSLVRNHLLLSSDSGLLTIGGGKWTTYRRMAEETVDEAIKLFDLSPKRPCETEQLLMIGSHGYSPNAYIRLIQHFGMESEVAQHLLHNYGDRAFEVASVATQTERRWPVTGVRLAYPYLFIEAEVRYACRREWACTAVDVLARRTRLAFLSAQAAEEALPRVIEIMAEELGWDAKRKDQERHDALEFLLTMGWTPDKHRSFKSDELAFYKQEFQELDRDRDGLVTSEELRGLFQRTSKSISPEQLKLLIANVDMHKNGVVGFDEFLEMMMGGEVIVTEGGMRPAGVDGGGV
jgi:glycerol-3-phosphate dehydrogenase